MNKVVGSFRVIGCFNWFKRRLTYTLLAYLISFNSVALTSLKLDCPEKFVGTVESIMTSYAPSLKDEFEKVTVDFKTNSKFRSVTMLKNGPYQFKVGGQYFVALKNDLICDIKFIK